MRTRLPAPTGSDPCDVVPTKEAAGALDQSRILPQGRDREAFVASVGPVNRDALDLRRAA